MKDPARLLESPSDGSEAELRLLRAGAFEEPPAAALQRLAARLGQAGTIGTIGTSGTVGEVRTLPPSPQPTAAVSFGLGAKLGLAAALIAAGALVWGVVWYASRSSHTAPAAQPRAAAPQVEAPAPELAAPSEAVPTPEITALSGSVSRELADEIGRLDHARTLLAGNRAKPALAVLRDYDREHPRGSLRQEATVLWIDALRRTGDHARARELAQRFLADNPDSPHAPRVRALAFDDAR